MIKKRCERTSFSTLPSATCEPSTEFSSLAAYKQVRSRLIPPTIYRLPIQNVAGLSGSMKRGMAWAASKRFVARKLVCFEIKQTTCFRARQKKGSFETTFRGLTFFLERQSTPKAVLFTNSSCISSPARPTRIGLES